MAKQRKKVNPLAAKILAQVEYQKNLENLPYEHFFEDFQGTTHYMNQASASVEARYSEEVQSANYARAFPLMIFFRLLDEDGNRVFTTQKHLSSLQGPTDMTWILNVGEQILAWDLEQVSLMDQKKTPTTD